MAALTIDTNRPAPKQWRKWENVLLIILLPAVTFTISNWGFENEALTNKLLLVINTPLVAIIKGIGYMLANGEDYVPYTAPKDAEQQNK